MNVHCCVLRHNVTRDKCDNVTKCDTNGHGIYLKVT